MVPSEYTHSKSSSEESLVSEYLPYAEKHSIVEAQIALLFAGEFAQAQIASARSVVEPELREQLPRSADIVQGSVSIDVTNRDTPVQTGPLSSSLAGFELSRTKGNGQPARVLRLTSNQILVSDMDYEAWETACPTVVDYINTALSALPLNGNPVLAIGLRFNDRYTFTGDHQSADAKHLFSASNDYMAGLCFSAGPTWHCNTGWFTSHQAGRVLHNLNIASALIDGASAATVEHAATLYVNTPRQSVDALLSPPTAATGLRPILDSLHDVNKDILRAVLKPDMLAKIGLYE